MSELRWGGLHGAAGASIRGDMKPRYLWLTPQIYIDAARQVMGDIDLDPATNVRVQQRIKARKFFTFLENGLLHPWHGRVWLNSNHGEILEEFAEKAIKEWKSGNTTEMIFLTHTKETWKPWFQAAGKHANAICFHNGEIDWVCDHTGYIETSEGRKNVNLSDYGIELEGTYDTHGSVFFYFGKQAEKFKQAFGQFGFCK